MLPCAGPNVRLLQWIQINELSCMFQLSQVSTSSITVAILWERLRRNFSLPFTVVCEHYFAQMSGVRNGVESAANGSPVAAVDGRQLDVPSPTAGNADPDSGPTQTSGHATESRATQVCFHESSTMSVTDSSIQGGSQRYLVDQQPLRPSRTKPTSFPESLIPYRFPQSVLMEESSTARRNQVDLLNSQQSIMKSSSDIPLNRTPTSSHSEPHYNYHRVMPPALYKSISSNIPPPHYPSRWAVHQTRPWRYPSSSTTRPVGLPYSISQQSLNSRAGCQCQCDSIRKQSGEGSSMDEESAMTPEGLSWRRLHMSRAKLKATATTSELLSGFAMVAMVELQINEPTNVPEWLFVMFSVCTTVLVAVHIFALMISTYLLPNIDAISKLQVHELVGQSPHERMRGFIELAWAFSTVLGLFLFLVEVAILCWVKFWDYSFTAAWAATIIVIPVLIVFVAFAVHFYHSLVVYKCEATVSDLQQLEEMKKQLDDVDCNPV